jgi:hypothetical protein
MSSPNPKSDLIIIRLFNDDIPTGRALNKMGKWLSRTSVCKTQWVSHGCVHGTGLVFSSVPKHHDINEYRRREDNVPYILRPDTLCRLRRPAIALVSCPPGTF